MARFGYLVLGRAFMFRPRRYTSKGSAGYLRPEGTESVGGPNPAPIPPGRPLFGRRAVCPVGGGVGASWARRTASAMALSARFPGISAAGTSVSAREPRGAARRFWGDPSRSFLLGTWLQSKRHSYPIRAVRREPVAWFLRAVRSYDARPERIEAASREVNRWEYPRRCDSPTIGWASHEEGTARCHEESERSHTAVARLSSSARCATLGMSS